MKMETLPSANGIPIDLLKHGEMKSSIYIYMYQLVLLSNRKPGKSGDYFD